MIFMHKETGEIIEAIPSGKYLELIRFERNPEKWDESHFREVFEFLGVL